MSSVRCCRSSILVANVAWHGVAVQALEHEALEAIFCCIGFFYSIAWHFEKRSTLVTEKLRRTCGHGVLCGREGRDVWTCAAGQV